MVKLYLKCKSIDFHRIPPSPGFEPTTFGSMLSKMLQNGWNSTKNTKCYKLCNKNCNIARKTEKCQKVTEKKLLFWAYFQKQWIFEKNIGIFVFLTIVPNSALNFGLKTSPTNVGWHTLKNGPNGNKAGVKPENLSYTYAKF